MSVSLVGWGPAMGVFEDQLLELARVRIAAADDAVLRRDYAAASAHAVVADAAASVAGISLVAAQDRMSRELLYGAEPAEVVRPAPATTAAHAEGFTDPAEKTRKRGV